MGGRGRPGSGVEARVETIRIGFTWNGKRCRETLDLKPTPQNIKAAEKLVGRINDEIRLGLFDYARHFPDSPHAKSADLTFSEFADQWLKTLTVAHSTQGEYAKSLAAVWKPAIGEKKLTAIKPSHIKEVIAQRMEKVSGKTVNNDLTPLRKVFEAAIGDELIAKSPAEKIKNQKHQLAPPDPFALEEQERILAELYERYPEPVGCYFEFAFCTGMRPSEMIILRWGRIDWKARTARVDVAVTRGQEKGTKTHTVRDVDLSPRAMAVLKRMKAHTLMKGDDAPIFMHPATGEPWNGDQYQRVSYFKPALKRLGIRMRDAYNTRHTYATVALMGGVNPAYIARQLGHVDMAMLFKRYAKWIDRADKGREADKLAALQGQIRGQKAGGDGNGGETNAS